MAPRRLLPLLRLISRLGLASGRSWTSFLAAAVSFLRKIATHPQVAELFRFIFLGTIVETGRKVAQKIADYTTDFFVVREHHGLVRRLRLKHRTCRSKRSLPWAISRTTGSSTT
ncbi:hypothetical protein FB451DRAFT_192222 [Mycena latifolia]|nr:hypothetical protein FB451DRAFT_192222 [Mycena latifolia]